jgi:hypothetical protein
MASNSLSAIILPFFFFCFPILFRDLAQFFGAERLHKKFSRITQKNAQIICDILPPLRKVADFRRRKFDQRKVIFYQHQKIFRSGSDLSQVGAIGRDVALAVRTRQSRARGRKSASSASASSGGADDGDGDGDGDGCSLENLSLLDLEKLSEILCIEKQTLKNKLSKNPQDLPPPLYLPGFRGPRWTKSVVKKWLKKIENFSGVQS